MMRNWKRFGLSTVVAVALTAAPAAAGGTDGVLPKGEKPRPATQEQLDDLKQFLHKQFKAISEVTKAHDDLLSALKANDDDTRLKLSDVQIKVARLDKLMREIASDLEGLRKQLPSATVAQYPPTDKAALEEIKTRLSQLQDAISRLQTGSGRTAFSPPTTGRLVFINLRPEDMLLVVGQRRWRVAPGASMTVEEAAGAVTYEVISDSYGLVRRNTPVLRADETITITAR
jgi:hypothetical protein